MGYGTKEKRDRNENIYILRRQGWTYARIAKKYKITRERVRQIYEVKVLQFS